MPNTVERDEQRVTAEMEHVGNYIAQVIEEQEKIRAVALGRLPKIKSDLRALRFRLKPYVSRDPKPRDATYYKLKNEYEDNLQRQYTAENTIQLIDETIANAKLNQVPGQYA